MTRRRFRQLASSLGFAAAAVCFGLGLIGRSGSWLAAMLASLALLTLAFFLASEPSRDP